MRQRYLSIKIVNGCHHAFIISYIDYFVKSLCSIRTKQGKLGVLVKSRLKTKYD